MAPTQANDPRIVQMSLRYDSSNSPRAGRMHSSRSVCFAPAPSAGLDVRVHIERESDLETIRLRQRSLTGRDAARIVVQPLRDRAGQEAAGNSGGHDCIAAGVPIASSNSEAPLLLVVAEWSHGSHNDHS